MGFLDAARSYPALLSVRSPVPELKDHAKRFPKGFPRISVTVSTIIATPIPELRNAVQETGTGTHSIFGGLNTSSR